MRNSMIDTMTPIATEALDTARARGADGAKIRFTQGEKVGCSFEAGRLKQASAAQNASYAVTVLARGRRARAEGTDPGDLDEIVSRAVALAQAGSVAHFDAWPAPGDVTAVERHSPETAELPRERLIDACERIVAALKDYDSDLFIEAGGSRKESEGLLVTTGGVRHVGRRTGWSLNAYAQRTDGTDMLFAGFGRAWNAVNELFDPDRIIAEILGDLRHGETVTPAPQGRTTALLSPEVFSMLLQAVELGVSGRNVAKGDSPLRGRIGERVLDASVTLIDDPHVPFAPGSAEVDGDGVPTRRTDIFTDGVLKGFLYDLDSAGLAGAEPTGHDHCSPHAPEVLPGDRPHEELLAGVDDGLLLKGLIGFGQGNLVNGDFSCNVGLGFRVRHGEIVGRVKNTMVAGNVYDLLAADIRLSSDRDEQLRLPWAVVEGLGSATTNE